MCSRDGFRANLNAKNARSRDSYEPRFLFLGQIAGIAMKKQIENRRAEIDSLDRQLLCLLNRRAKIAYELGILKLKAELPLYDRARELRILGRLKQNNSGPLDNCSVTRIFQLIIRESRRIQGTQHKHSSLNTPYNGNEGERG
jgi:chorismate mutase